MSKKQSQKKERTPAEIKSMISRLQKDKEIRKEFNLFGENVWATIDAMIDVLEGTITDEDDVYSKQDEGEYEEYHVYAAIDALQWMSGEDVELTDVPEEPVLDSKSKKQHKTPCHECPFRKNSLPGYLGESSYKPQEFLQQLELPAVHPCHTHVNWESKNVDEQMKNAPRCVGALQFMNNSMKQSRNADMRTLQDQLGKNPQVFNWSKEFCEHHQK